MRIICPTCASHYEVDRDKIGATGQLVRCASCREVWLVRSPEEVEAEQRALAEQARRRKPEPPSLVATAATPAAPIDFQAARVRLRRRDPGLDAVQARGNGPAASLMSLGAVVLTGLGLVLGFRDAVARRLPATAPAFAALGLPVNLQGLALRDVRTVLTDDGGKRVLSLQGQIANLRDEPTAVPNLTVVVRDDSRTPLYTWTATAPKSTLARGESVAFSSRLSTPPSGGRDVHVSFAQADTAAAAR